jgi:hypothetical protein
LSKLGSKWFGAHVVAPCPHDGRCPLSGPGAQAWCHFGTRFQRPGFMQVGCTAVFCQEGACWEFEMGLARVRVLAWCSGVVPLRHTLPTAGVHAGEL